MTRETLAISVESTGVFKATRGMNALGAAGNRAAGSADLVNKALRLVGGGLIIRQLGRTADSYRNISNRIATVTKTHAEAAEVMERVFKIANDTRQSFEATGIVYARIANAATDLGKSHEEVLSLVRGLNQAMAIGGTTSREANAALIQFSQGLASGTLRGDELRSVLEQSVVVSEVLSRGLGVTRGELKKMGEQGKISSQLIFDAFKKMEVELETRFGELIPTLSQSFEIFKNHFTKFIGELNEGIGVTRLLGQALVFLAQNLDIVVRLIGLIASRMVLGLAIKMVLRLAWAVKILGIAILKNPLLVLKAAFISIIGLIPIAIGLVVVFASKIKLLEKPTNELANAISKSADNASDLSDQFSNSTRNNVFFAKSIEDIKDDAMAMAVGLRKTSADVNSYAASTKVVDANMAKVAKGIKKSHGETSFFATHMATAAKKTKATSEAAATFAKRMDKSGRKALLLARGINRSSGNTKTLVKQAAKLAKMVKKSSEEAARFGQELDKSSGRAMTFQDVLSAAWDEAKIGAGQAAEYITKTFRAMGIDIDLSFKGIAMFAGKMVDSIYQIFYFGGLAFVDAWSGLPGMLGDIMMISLNIVVDQIESAINKIINGILKLGGVAAKYGLGPAGFKEGHFKAAEKLQRAMGGVNLGDVENPWEGQAKEMGIQITDAMVTAFAQTPVQDLIERIWAAAAAKAKAWRAPPDLAKPGTDKTKPPSGDADAKKFRKSFKSLENSMLPVLAATRKQEEAHKLLNRAYKEKLITDEQYVLMQHRIDESLKAGLNPFGDMLDKMKEENRLLTLTEPVRARELAMKAIGIDLNKKHEKSTQEQVDALVREYDEKVRIEAFNEKMRAQQEREKAIYDQIRGPQLAYTQGMEDLNRVYASTDMNAREYARTLDALRITFLNTQTDFNSGIERALLKLKAGIADAASATEQVVAGMASSTESALSNSITGFTQGWDKGLESAYESFKTFINDILAQLTRLMIRQSLFALLGMGAGGGAPLPDIIRPGSPLGGFASGGSFKVGGTGGPDSQQVAFMATPGERVAITTPGQTAGPQAPPVVNLQIVNQTDPNDAVSAMNTPGGRKVILNTIRENSQAVKRIVA